MTRSGQPRQGRLIGPKRHRIAPATACATFVSVDAPRQWFVTSFSDFGLIESDFSDLPSSHPRQREVGI
jgi:hypothetical protein